MFVKDNLNYEVILCEDFDNSSIILIKLSNLNIKICGFYRSPKTNISAFLQKIEWILELHANIVFLGDININLLSNTDHNNTLENYLNILNTHNLKIINTINKDSHTYNINNYYSILDHIFSDLHKLNAEFSTKSVTFSNHSIVSVDFSVNIYDKCKMINLKLIDFKQIDSKISNIDLTKIDYSDFISKLQSTMQSSTSINKIKAKHIRRKRWMNDEIIQLINERDYLFSQSKKFPCDNTIKDEFLKTKHITANAIRIAKSEYFDRTFSECIGNNRKTWANINNLLYNRPFKQREGISKILSNNKPLESKNDMSNEFAKYFSEIPLKLVDTLNKQNNFQERTQTYKQSCINSIMLSNVETDEVEEIIRNLSNQTSCGLNGITVRVLKECVISLAPKFAY